MSFPSQGYTPSFSTVTQFPGKLITSVTNLARSANQEWFASDIIPTPINSDASEIIIQFCFSEKSEFEISLDSGVTWCKINNAFRPEDETINTFVFMAINTDMINFRAEEAGTIRYARIFEKGGTT